MGVETDTMQQSGQRGRRTKGAGIKRGAVQGGGAGRRERAAHARRSMRGVEGSAAARGIERDPRTLLQACAGWWKARRWRRASRGVRIRSHERTWGGAARGIKSERARAGRSVRGVVEGAAAARGVKRGPRTFNRACGKRDSGVGVQRVRGRRADGGGGVKRAVCRRRGRCAEGAGDACGVQMAQAGAGDAQRAGVACRRRGASGGGLTDTYNVTSH